MPTIPTLLAVSDRLRVGPDGWSAWCSALAAAGVGGLQVRERDLDDRELLELAMQARSAFPRPGVLLVNRRFDIASAADADGVHLPAAGLPVAPVRKTVGAGLLVGRSTHDLDEVRIAHEQGADYVIYGPVFETPSKRDRIAPRGLDALGDAIAVGVPVVAIGGIDAGSVGEVLRRGAAGVAAIRAFADADRAAELVAAAREAGR